MDIESFKADLTNTGYQEVLEKTYAPNQFIETHKHPFRARAVITAGEMTISWGGFARIPRRRYLRNRSR
ncbi:hypothetical protein VSR69_25950 [Paraburkholderia phytofirmans]|uniref:hypothetical protein n=1 Tax=Paraburkholderia sp. BL9I2N2 TaxID=1938809 RepID=UPI0010435AD7|nr:hypothetical protein [Paraburkholderia sp. BL9I2N2]